MQTAIFKEKKKQIALGKRGGGVDGDARPKSGKD